MKILILFTIIILGLGLSQNINCLAPPSKFKHDKGWIEDLDSNFIRFGEQASTHLVEKGLFYLSNNSFMKICRKKGEYQTYLNTIVYILDKYFRKKGYYKFPHVVKPLGYVDNEYKKWYYMEYAEGIDGYCIPVYDEWGDYFGDPAEYNEVMRWMGAAGVSFIDLADPFNAAYTKNIMFVSHRKEGIKDIDNVDWKLIDFESNNVFIHPHKLEKYVKNMDRSLLLPEENNIFDVAIGIVLHKKHYSRYWININYMIYRRNMENPVQVWAKKDVLILLDEMFKKQLPTIILSKIARNKKLIEADLIGMNHYKKLKEAA